MMPMPTPTPHASLRRALSGQSAALAVAAIAGLLALSAPAFADLKLCNITTSRVGVALGYSDTAGGWTTEGWWTLPAQTCETIYKGVLNTRYWYVHAVDYDSGGEWAGQSFMCTHDKAFTIKGVQDCAKRGYNRTGFFEVDTQGSKDWTIRLTDPSEGGPKAK
jgi:uncharacterized membrane protein